MSVRMQQRRGTAAQWALNNPVLSAGEFGVETDTSKVKVGDGTTAWNALGYVNAAEVSAAAAAAEASATLAAGYSAPLAVLTAQFYA